MSVYFVLYECTEIQTWGNLKYMRSTHNTGSNWSVGDNYAQVKTNFVARKCDLNCYTLGFIITGLTTIALCLLLLVLVMLEYVVSSLAWWFSVWCDAGMCFVACSKLSHDPDVMTFCVPWCVEPYIHYCNVGQKALQELVPTAIRKYGGPPA